jgi:hypothetical protein
MILAGIATNTGAAKYANTQKTASGLASPHSWNNHIYRVDVPKRLLWMGIYTA